MACRATQVHQADQWQADHGAKGTDSIWPLSQGKNGSPWSNQSSHSTELEFVGLVELEPLELRH